MWYLYESKDASRQRGQPSVDKRVLEYARTAASGRGEDSRAQRPSIGGATGSQSRRPCTGAFRRGPSKYGGRDVRRYARLLEQRARAIARGATNSRVRNAGRARAQDARG